MRIKMIKISTGTVDPNSIADQYAQNSVERKIIDILNSSSKEYKYDSSDQLKFELNLRKSIINAARELSQSRMSFRVFRKSKCNSDYWHRTNEGGFMLESGVKPSEAIKDIFIHGSDYGTECSTAMVIVYYKALADIFPEDLFNKMFSEIYLMNWAHLDHDLGIVDNISVGDYLPGDGRYFKNPDVDPASPEWQGENVFDLGNEAFYGHGIGISNADRIIHALNQKRIKDSTVSAYLMDSAKRPDFKYLASKYYSYAPSQETVSYIPQKVLLL
jgi:protein-glutamine gamma-glutamyltransferase